MTRRLLYQLALIALIAGGAWWLGATAQANLARLGVDAGIDFLWQRAGFEIGQTLIPFDADSSFARAFVVALLNTLVLAATGVVCATTVGGAIGLCRLSGNWLVSRLAAIYVELLRNVPALLHVFFWYFVVLRSLPRPPDSLALPGYVFLNNRGLFLPAPGVDGGGAWLAGALALALIAIALLRRRARRRRWDTGRGGALWLPATILLAGLPLAAVVTGLAGLSWDPPRPGRFGYEGGLVLMPEFLALAVGLSLYNATYVAEIVRSGFQCVPRGQLEAAAALGLARRHVVRLVLLPQALRAIIPPLTTVYLNLFKGTSLAAAIAYPEVVSVFVGTVNNLAGQPVVIMAITLLVYVFVSLCIAAAMHAYERRTAFEHAR